MEVPVPNTPGAERLNKSFSLLHLQGNPLPTASPLNNRSTTDATKRCSDGPAENEPQSKRLRMVEALLGVAGLLDEKPDNARAAQQHDLENMVALVCERVLARMTTLARTPVSAAPIMYKTQMCHHYCPYGKRCTFAHGPQQLGQPVRQKKKNKKRNRAGIQMPQNSSWLPTAGFEAVQQSAFQFIKTQEGSAGQSEDSWTLTRTKRQPTRKPERKHAFVFEGVSTRAAFGSGHQSGLVSPPQSGFVFPPSPQSGFVFPPSPQSSFEFPPSSGQSAQPLDYSRMSRFALQPANLKDTTHTTQQDSETMSNEQDLPNQA